MSFRRVCMFQMLGAVPLRFLLELLSDGDVARLCLSARRSWGLSSRTRLFMLSAEQSRRTMRAWSDRIAEQRRSGQSVRREIESGIAATLAAFDAAAAALAAFDA